MGFRPKSPACRGCPAERAGRSFVPWRGSLEARVAAIGQGPGEQEARTGVPFHPEAGAAGRKFAFWCHAAGLQQSDMLIWNVVQCWLPKNRPPTAAETRFCYQAHLGPVLHQMPNLKLIHPIGVPAMKLLMGPHVTEAWAGSLMDVPLPPLESKPCPTP